MTPTPDRSTLDLGDFSVGGMLRAGLAIRQAVGGATTLEQAATAVVQYFRDHCVDQATGERACPLVRLYKTHPFGSLEPALQAFAATRLGELSPTPSMRCLTLVASAGEEPDWNSRHSSRGHRAIPLPSVERVRAAPMIARLIEALGVGLDSLLTGARAQNRGVPARSYDVFHVEEALGSPYIPSQHDFVIPYRIASVVGFGGLLRTGELFAVVLFSRVHVSARSAARFRAIALDVRSSLFAFDDASTWIP